MKQPPQTAGTPAATASATVLPAAGTPATTPLASETPEQLFVSRLAARLGHLPGGASESAQAAWDPAPSLPAAPPALSQDDLAQRFLTAFERLGGHGLRARTEQEAVDYVAAVATRRTGGAGLGGTGAFAGTGGRAGTGDAGDVTGAVLLWDDPLLAGLNLPELLAARGLEVVVWNDSLDSATAKAIAERSAVGITTADWVVAETGSIALPTSPGRGRLVSLLPPVHVALIPGSRLLPSLAELFRRIAREVRAGASDLPSSLALATGPSRSADIENDLTVGVHGPKEVHVVLLPDATGALR